MSWLRWNGLRSRCADAPGAEIGERLAGLGYGLRLARRPDVRILTMNIFAHHRNWDERRHVLRAGLGDLRPDVATFQEAITTDGYDQVTDILGPGYHVFHQGGRSTDGGGASIASRWPLEVIREVDLQVDRRLYQSGWIGSVAIVAIAAPEPIGSVLLVHHKPTWQSGAEAERELQALTSARIVEEMLGGDKRHVVLAGDFDATPDAASIRFWTGRQSLDGTSVYYQDAWEAVHGDEAGHTFTPVNGIRSDRWRPRPGRRIDYIMVRCGDHGATLDIKGCDLAFDLPVEGTWASDHFGVVADLEPAPSTETPP
jgi:endonuclease/exonuclease/phosphatase family metal-dependent hydrolase